MRILSSLSTELPTDAPAFDEVRPVLVITAQESLAAAVFAALDLLTCPGLRAVGPEAGSRLCQKHTFALLLVDVSLCDRDGRIPTGLRGDLNEDTPWMFISSGFNWNQPDAITCSNGSDSGTLSELIAGELERVAEGRVLTTARLMVGAPSRFSAVPMPPALQAAHRLDWINANDPSLERAANVVSEQENLAKQLVRLAHALGGDAVTRSWDLERVLLNLGLMRVIPLVKIVAARLIFPVRDANRRATLDAIWRFGVARAIVMRALAGKTTNAPMTTDGHHAFDAGLFADTGAGLLIWLRDQSDPRRPSARTAKVLSPQIVAYHEWVGERLLDRWKQPRPIGNVAGGHHLGTGGEPATLRALAAAAGALVEEAGLGPDPTGGGSCREAKRAFDLLGVSSQDRANAVGLVTSELERVEEAFIP